MIKTEEKPRKEEPETLTTIPALLFMLSWTLSSSPFLASQRARVCFAALGAVKKAVALFP